MLKNIDKNKFNRINQKLVNLYLKKKKKVEKNLKRGKKDIMSL